jgi:hypothetical protein
MKTIVFTLRELYGLFVEDVTYTIAIVVWLVFIAFALPHLVAPQFLAPVLFAGLGLILLENVVRSARKR